jgi:hypothetical protein
MVIGLCFDIVNFDCYWASWFCELESVRLKIEKDLLESFLVRHYKEILLETLLIVISIQKLHWIFW